MAGNGQGFNDRLNALRYALVGQGLARTVCKATTEEILGPKKKHIDYLIACTNEPNVSIPQLANLLIERTQHTSWAVVFKALTTIHHLMWFGNERFTQYLATSNHSFELNDFMDRTTPQGYTMSTFVRRYAKYVNDKSISYRTLAIDLCKIPIGNENPLRVMNMDNLSKTLPIVQTQFDSLVEFGADTKDLNNGIIMSAFRLLYKDLVKLYPIYQEAIINLVERYFKLSRRKTREALEMYKRFLALMDKMAAFFKIVEAVGQDKSEMPDLTKFATILKTLEDHLATLEAKRRGATAASPEADDQAEEPAGASVAGGGAPSAPSVEKENKPPASDAGPSKKEPESSGAGSAIGDGAGGAAPPKKPPARPSPAVSPKESPSDARPATTPAAPPAASSEKKAPPERPAKPPSRPPPPSVVAPAQPAASSSPSNAASSSSSSQAPGQTKTVSVSPTPPAHPPPPSGQARAATTPSPPPPPPVEPTSSEATSADQQQLPDGPTATPAHQQQIDAGQADDGSSGASPAPVPSGGQVGAPSCSTVVSAESVATVQAGDSETGADTNHVSSNNVEDHLQANGPAEEMPPPPPPIDDDEEHQQDGNAGGDQQQQADPQDRPAEAEAPEVAPEEPAPVAAPAEGDHDDSAANQAPQVNGQNGRADSSNNNNNNNNGAVA